jgi:hypothetical protein
MLNRCANPGCARRFRKLEDGKLFLVEVDIAEAAAGAGRFGRHLEHYWLCDQCASVLTLSIQQERGVVAVPLAHSMKKKPATSVRSGGITLTASNRTYGRMRATRGGANEV